MIRNLLVLNEIPQGDEELFEPLYAAAGVTVERIVSAGQTTPEGTWLQETGDEWVVLLQGSATLAFVTGETFDLTAGDCCVIPAGTRHRVTRTSVTPPCLWLAVHTAGAS